MNLWLIFCEKLADNVINAENMRHFREDYAGGSAKLISCVSLKSTQQITIPFKIFHQPPPMGFSFVAATTILDNNPTRFFFSASSPMKQLVNVFFSSLFYASFTLAGGWFIGGHFYSFRVWWIESFLGNFFTWYANVMQTNLSRIFFRWKKKLS